MGEAKTNEAAPYAQVSSDQGWTVTGMSRRWMARPEPVGEAGLPQRPYIDSLARDRDGVRIEEMDEIRCGAAQEQCGVVED